MVMFPWYYHQEFVDFFTFYEVRTPFMHKCAVYCIICSGITYALNVWWYVLIVKGLIAMFKVGTTTDPETQKQTKKD